jgi:hypothetical protein
MHKNLSVVSWLIAVSLVLILTAGIASAATVTQAISYSGNLTNAAGTPLTGTYTVTFRLYNVAAGGTALATDTHSVTATKGQYTTTLTFPAALYNGQGLWLGIKRGTDPEKTPRTVFQPVPYALGLRPGVVGASFTTNKAGTTWPGLPGINISTTYAYNPGIRVLTSGSRSDGILVSTSGPNSNGVRAYASGSNGDAVYAYHYGPGNGVTGISASSGTGVYGNSTSGTGVYGGSTNKYGVHGYSKYNTGIYGRSDTATGIYGESPKGSGVKGYSTSGNGVYGIGKTGGYFTTNSGGSSWDNPSPAVNVSTSYANNVGVRIITRGNDSHGVYVNTSGEYSQGVRAITSGEYSQGVRAITSGEYSQGVFGYTTGDSSSAIVGSAYGAASNGVYAYSIQDSAIYANTERSDNSYGVETPDKMYAMSFDTTHIDVAEYFPVMGDTEPGTVLVIGADKTLEESTTEYDSRVAGIVSTSPGMSLGIRKEGNTGEAPVAVAGRVPCKVDATHAPIHAGDILTTSANPGYAMKAEPVEISGILIYRPGTILGKAMGTLESGTGTIEVLVTLQ